MLLSFEFVMVTVSTTHQCFGYGQAVLAQHQGFLIQLCPSMSRLDMHKKLGRDTTSTTDLN